MRSLPTSNDFDNWWKVVCHAALSRLAAIMREIERYLFWYTNAGKAFSASFVAPGKLSCLFWIFN